MSEVSASMPEHIAGELDAHSKRIKHRKLMAVIIVDVLVVAELTIAMYVASKSQYDFTIAFIMTFFALFIPTMVMSWFIHRKLRSSEA